MEPAMKDSFNDWLNNLMPNILTPGQWLYVVTAVVALVTWRWIRLFGANFTVASLSGLLGFTVAGAISVKAAAVLFFIVTCIVVFLEAYPVNQFDCFGDSHSTYKSGTYQRRRLDRKRAQSKEFPPPYPNTWYRVCESSDIRKGGDPFTVAMLGSEFVAFRGDDGKAGVLHAFCPHLGTHLGLGGRVEGNTVVCPYHEWKFDAAGQCTDIPYCKGKIPARAHARCFIVCERGGVVFMWYDAEGRAPAYPMDLLAEVEDPSGGFREVAVASFSDLKMHIMEPSQNSADHYHFRTVHRTLAGTRGMLHVDHQLVAAYGNSSSPPALQGQMSALPDDFDTRRAKIRPEHLLIREVITGIRLFNAFWMPQIFYKSFLTHVLILGPSLILFQVDSSILGPFRALMTLQPTQPFCQRLVMKAWAGPRWVWPIARCLMYAVMRTVDQDRLVWEHKMHVAPRNVVAGDGPFAGYGNWLAQFYSDHSTSYDDVLDW